MLFFFVFFFSVMADEARDVSNTEQLSLIIRYVNTDLDIKEKFVGFLECTEGVTGEGLASIILAKLGDIDLNIQKVWGQCYDGTGNVVDKSKGLASYILRINFKEIYTHCTSHRLNLAVASQCQILDVKNLHDNIAQIT